MHSKKKPSGHYKGVSNYFNRGDRNKYVGIVLISISIILFFVGMGWMSYIIMCTVFPLGLAFMLLDSFNKFTDKDMDEYVDVEKKRFLEKIDEIKRTEKNKSIKTYILAESYIFNENEMIKQGRDGKVRTAKYSLNYIYLSDGHIFALNRDIDILNSRSQDKEMALSIDDICDVQVVSDVKTFEYNKRTYRARQSFLDLKCKNFNTSFAVQDSLTLDEFVTEMKKRIYGKD